MKVTLLGISGGYPKANGACSSYLVEANGKKILLDMGSGSLSKLLDVISPNELDAIVLSHFHYDHCTDLLPFIYTIQMQRSSGIEIPNIPLYCLKNDSPLCGLICDDTVFDTNFVKAGQALDILGIRFSFFKTMHPVDCIAMRIEAEGKVLAYTADSSKDSDCFEELLSNADLAIMDCGELDASTSVKKNHMTPSDCHRISKNHNVRKVVLSHIIPHFDIETYRFEASQFEDWNYIIASVGEIITL